MKFLLLAIGIALAEIEFSHALPSQRNDVKPNEGEFTNFKGFKFYKKRDTAIIKGGEFHDFGDIAGRKKRENSATIIGGEFHDFGDIKDRKKRDNIAVIKGGEFHDFGDIKGRKKRENIATIIGGEFHDFGDIKGRKKRDNIAVIKGGEFHDFGDINGGEFTDFDSIKGKSDTELSRISRRCRDNGGDFTGLSESEKAKLKSNCKVVGGDFGDDRRSLDAVSSEEEDNQNYNGGIRLWKWNKAGDQGRYSGYYGQNYKADHALNEDVTIKIGNYAGQGQGVGSLSDITGAKNHLIGNGNFHSFGDILG